MFLSIMSTILFSILILGVYRYIPKKTLNTLLYVVSLLFLIGLIIIYRATGSLALSASCVTIAGITYYLIKDELKSVE